MRIDDCPVQYAIQNCGSCRGRLRLIRQYCLRMKRMFGYHLTEKANADLNKKNVKSRLKIKSIALKIYIGMLMLHLLCNEK